MTTREKLESKGLNLNTVIGITTLIAMLSGVIIFLAPLKSLPEDNKLLQIQMAEVRQTQAVQTQSLQTLAEVAKDSREMRRDIDRIIASTNAKIDSHDRDLDSIKAKLNRLDRVSQ